MLRRLQVTVLHGIAGKLLVPSCWNQFGKPAISKHGRAKYIVLRYNIFDAQAGLDGRVPCVGSVALPHTFLLA
ncbi:MAG: hypothetical protein DMG97_02835 [Acidobacteria bacterium]|nr:MAG: hypothetical protein DMG97_02835 [Acidobacteriota bacterium]